MTKPRIEFTAYFADQLKPVELFSPDGGGEGYHVRIDHYHHGVIFRRNNQWVFYGNDLSFITGADVLILGDIIDKANAK